MTMTRRCLCPPTMPRRHWRWICRATRRPAGTCAWIPNFAFAPEHASRDHVPGEGHAHVYVNGVKLGRFYGPWLHLDNLPPGEVTVEVTLNANDHRPLSVAGKPVAQTVVIAN